MSENRGPPWTGPRDSYDSRQFLFNAGWLFCAAWIAVLAVIAFGRDLLPAKAHLDPAQPPRTANAVSNLEPRAR